MSEKFNQRGILPTGHRKISVHMDGGLPTGPMQVEGSIPDGELFPSETKRLSRKVLRNYGYGPAEWNDAARTILKTREATERIVMNWMNASAWITLREIHDANLPPEKSLRELQLITMNDVGKLVDGKPAYPTEYISYDLEADTLQRWRIDDYQEAMDPIVAQASVEATRVEGTDRERSILYARLLFLAGE